MKEVDSLVLKRETDGLTEDEYKKLFSLMYSERKKLLGIIGKRRK